jgi:hypothetical protein
MKKYFLFLVLITLISFVTSTLYSQKNQSSSSVITASDLESHVSFLASPLLKGRKNGDEGLEIAAQYIATQAKLSGLKPANGNSYFQPYSIIKKSIDPEKTTFKIITGKADSVTISKPVFQLMPTGPADFLLEGEVAFAGYGLKLDQYKYNDFENIKTEGKILLVLTRAPSSPDGQTFLFEGPKWNSFMSIQVKLTTLMYSKAKAILFVQDPKSGFSSFDEQFPDFAAQLGSTMSLKGEKSRSFDFPGMPKIMFIDRSVADALLSGTGNTLEDLQKNIDANLKSNSFNIENKKLKLTEVSMTSEVTLRNVAGYVEGSDPVLKNELIVFSGHYDHIGGAGDRINTGADDDASGCAALLSMAKAFSSLEKKPLRSVLFLWVSGEEIGLYGSKSYVESPLFPLNKTVADLNMDMIGRVKEAADSTSETPMTGKNQVFVITDNQSKELIAIADQIDKKSPLDFDYSLSGRDHPLQLFARSDHYNFVEKDIPILFFSTGLHADYHTPRDVVSKLDFSKMELVTRTMFDIGLTVANKKTRIVVDNPFSSWGKSK